MGAAIKVFVGLVLGGALALQAQAATAVLQHGYDLNATSANLAETSLNTANVSGNTFGLLFSLAVDDKVYAQPLYVPHVAMPGLGTHNLLIVATMNDTVYAFDADAPGVALWSLNLAGLFSTTAVPWGEFQINSPPNANNLGIMSTPVIDPATNILYVVACTLENGTMAYRVHAIDVTTGAEPYGAGTLISASYGSFTFTARYQTQRVSLALAGNPASQVVFGFGAMEQESNSIGNYAGWVMAYNTTGPGMPPMQQTGAFAVVSTGNGGGGVWQSGRPPAVDGNGDFYVFTGNGWGNGYDGVNNFAESVLKFDVSNGLALVDWFTPSNWTGLDKKDHDLTSSGPMLIPGTNPALLTGGGKEGDLYVLNATNLGKYVLNDTQIIQKQNITGNESGNNEFRAGPAYWNRSAANGGPLMYNWAGADTLKAFSFNGTTFSTGPVASNPYSAILPGGALAVSANGDQPGSGILWATRFDPTIGPGYAVLHAFDASNVANELWNSAMFPSRDAVGKYAKHVPPVVTNGKVYVANWSNKVNVYGLGAKPASFTLAPLSLNFGNVQVLAPSSAQAITFTNTGTASLTIKSIAATGTAAVQYSQTNSCGASLAAGASCTVNVVFTPAAAGAQGAWLSVNLGGAGTKAVALSGTGVPASFGLTPSSLTFGSIQAGSQSAAQAVTVTNTGLAAFPITGVAFMGTGATQFTQTNTCSAAIAAGANCTINVVFAPAAAGVQSATLNVSGGGATQTVTVGGTGLVPFSVSPTSLPFGNVNTGTTSAPLTVTVTNTGSASLPVTGVTIAGANGSSFSQTNTCGPAVAPGSTCSVSVVFSPTATGSQSATLSITAAAGTQNVSLSGSGTAATLPSFALSPASVPIGYVTATTASAAVPVTVTNTGTVSLTVSGISFVGGTPGVFAQTNTCGSPLAPGATCTVNVVLIPVAAGYVFTNLNVTGGGGAGTKAVNVNGTGSVPFTALPATLAFGNVPRNTSSAPQLVTVTNVGAVTMPIPSLAFANAAAAEYSQTNTCSAALAVGASCTVSVVFTPTATGNQAAQLKVIGPGQLQKVALSGTGT